MAEGPTAPPEPVPWGTESDPFPVGTRIEVPTDDAPGGREVLSVDGRSSNDLVSVDGFGLMVKEVQGRLDEEGWRIAGYTYDLFPGGRQREITEARIRAGLAYHYGKDNSFREFHKNVRKDSHGTVGSIVYSLDGSPPKGYAVYIPELRKASLYSNHGERFKVYSSTTLVDWEEDEEANDE